MKCCVMFVMVFCDRAFICVASNNLVWRWFLKSAIVADQTCEHQHFVAVHPVWCYGAPYSWVGAYCFGHFSECEK